MYFGALHVLTSPGNPERFSQSAQSLRELIEGIWIEYDPLLKKKGGRLKTKVRDLKNIWMKVRKSKGKIITAMQMDMKQLDGFFTRLDEFFAWNDQFLPSRAEQAARAMTNMDRMLGKLPSVIMNLRVQEFQSLRQYFEDVAHHHSVPSSEADFLSYVTALEIFLIERLRPRASENFAEIQKLIDEGEANA
jgi:hypothetical protein